MKIGRSAHSAFTVAAIGALAGCASVPQAELDRRAADVKVYRMDQTVDRGYEIVGRVWGDSWKSALVLPTSPSEEAAVGAMRTEAVRLGADGLVNVNCLKQVIPLWSQSTEPPILCYAVAVRFRQGAG
jgi:uncharacterized protein YbjQ (UPF0145 family)